MIVNNLKSVKYLYIKNIYIFINLKYLKYLY